LLQIHWTTSSSRSSSYLEQVLHAILLLIGQIILADHAASHNARMRAAHVNHSLKHSTANILPAEAAAAADEDASTYQSIPAVISVRANHILSTSTD
jgi:hypothetical protein